MNKTVNNNQDRYIDFFDELSLDQQKEIEEATLEIEQGLTTDYETFIAKYR